MLSAASDGGKRGTGRDSARNPGQDFSGRIREAISIGVPLYNAGDPAACAEVYEVCVRDIEPGEEAQDDDANPASVGEGDAATSRF